MTDKVATFLIKILNTEDKREVYVHASARMVPPTAAPALERQLILNLIEANGFDKFQRDEQAIDELVHALVETAEQIKTEEDAESVEFDTQTIAYAVDAEVVAKISTDKMHASALIRPAKGGEEMTLDKVKTALEEIGVTYGINDEAIEALIKQSLTTEEDELEEDVAFGKEPINGEDAKFIPLVPTAMERILKPQLRDDGTVDMHDLGDLPTVKAGAEIMRKEPPTDGEKGINVGWELLAPKKGIDKKFKVGPGTEISPNDELLLLSTISGQPNLVDNGMRVDDAVQVKAVDLHTGNMILDANLLVKGDIGEGMKVRCEGDVTVGGVIESADVEAKGNIIVGKGIIGRPHFDHDDVEFSCHVKAEGEISALYASYADLKSEGVIHIAEQLLHCDTYSKSNIVVGNEKTVGSQIVGGFTKATEGIESDILGASAGVVTKLDLSGRLEMKHMELTCVSSIIAGRQQMHATMCDALSKFTNLPQTPARQEHIVKIKNTVTYLGNEVKKAEEMYDKLKEEAEELCHGVQVKIKHKMHPNVSLAVGHHVFKTRRIREAGKLYFLDGDIHYKSQNMED